MAANEENKAESDLMLVQEAFSCDGQEQIAAIDDACRDYVNLRRGTVGGLQDMLDMLAEPSITGS
jgi:hypothetical protein